MYWQAVGALKLAKAAGLIHSGDECMAARTSVGSLAMKV
jgi:hypothetical protein